MVIENVVRGVCPIHTECYGVSPSIGVSVCTVFTWAVRCYGTIGRSRPLTATLMGRPRSHCPTPGWRPGRST